jgi:CRISPR/Cas system CSM-associated protein Csm3 (group 7 of RAMP superfamily)
VLRAHCEKIARTVARPEREQQMATRLTCDPLKSDARAADGGCGEKFNRWADKSWNQEVETARKVSAVLAFHHSCFVCQLFGNTALASHARISDAYPPSDQWEAVNRTEERHGVAIDRVYGSVAVGPFQFETVTSGKFSASLLVRNFTVAQLGLLGLALRDLRQQRISIGFAKSRGLGRVKLEIETATLRYPMGEFLPGLEAGRLPGVGALLHHQDATAAAEYGYKADDVVEVPGLTWRDDGWGGRQADYHGDASLDAVWQAGVSAWKRVVVDGR